MKSALFLFAVLFVNISFAVTVRAEGEQSQYVDYQAAAEEEEFPEVFIDPANMRVGLPEDDGLPRPEFTVPPEFAEEHERRMADLKDKPEVAEGHRRGREMIHLHKPVTRDREAEKASRKSLVRSGT